MEKNIYCVGEFKNNKREKLIRIIIFKNLNI